MHYLLIVCFELCRYLFIGTRYWNTPFVLHYTNIIITKRGREYGGIDQVMEGRLPVFIGPDQF
jgi:hypothetical protein